MNILSDDFNKVVRQKLQAIILLFVLSGLPGFGQQDAPAKNYLLSTGIGYNFSLASGTLGSNSTNQSITGIYGSWGQGMLVNIDFGMRTCENLYTMLSLNYLNGRNIKSSSLYDNSNSSFDQRTINHMRIPMLFTVGSRYYLDLDCIAPSWADNSQLSKVEPYFGIGVGLALGSRMNNRIISESIQNNIENSLEIKSVTSFKPAATLYGELGFSYQSSERLAVFAGFKGNSLSLINSKERIRSYVEDGIEQSDRLTTAEFETIFVKNWNQLENLGPEAPTKQLAERHPASGLTFSIGILYDIDPVGEIPLFNLGKIGGFLPGRGKGRRLDPGKVNVTPDKIKAAAANKICKDCPKIKLKISSNNDEAVFPEKDIIIKRKGPWGGAKLKNVSILKSVVLCEQCPNSGSACCCMIDSLTVFFTFQIIINQIKIKKGVWLNTNVNDPENFGSTITGKKLPKDLENKQDWKLVDRKSVEIHERQHFADLQIILRDVIVEELERFEVEQRPCSKLAQKDCEKHVVRALTRIANKLNDKALEKARAIAKSENEDYSRGSDLEKRARTIQAAELNERLK
jgi:hypothetical protein